jgi:hypothetical protein
MLLARADELIDQLNLTTDVAATADDSNSPCPPLFPDVLDVRN